MISLRPLPALIILVVVLAVGVGAIQLFRSGIGQPAATPTPTAATSCPTGPPTIATAEEVLEDAAQAVVTTNRGSFTIELYPEDAPLATANFVALARCGFYEGIEFHRILAGFVAQAGDPHSDPDRPGSDPALIGTGGPGYRFQIEPPADDLRYVQYSVSMANAGEPNTNGSQFFIALGDLTTVLDREYTIFGHVIQGTDVVDAIGRVPVNGPAGAPLEHVIIESIQILSAPGASPSPG